MIDTFFKYNNQSYSNNPSFNKLKIKFMSKILITLFLFFSLYSFGQVSEGMKPMSRGNNNALTVSLSGVSVNEAEKIWKKYVDKYDGRDKWNKKAKELFIDNASISTIGDNTVDLYSKAETMGDGVLFSVWFDLGGAYLSSIAHADKYVAASEVLSGYYREVEKYKTEQKLDNEENKLKDLTGNMKDLARDKESYEKDIKKAEEKINDLRARIEQNNKDQAAKQAEIDAQRSVVDGVKSTLGKI